MGRFGGSPSASRKLVSGFALDLTAGAVTLITIESEARACHSGRRWGAPASESRSALGSC